MISVLSNGFCVCLCVITVDAFQNRYFRDVENIGLSSLFAIYFDNNCVDAKFVIISQYGAKLC